MKIAACPRCGSKRIGMGTLRAGIIFGVTSWKSVCRECGYQGEPFLFDTEKEYNTFFHQLSKNDNTQPPSDYEKPATPENDEIDQLSEKDKEVLSLLHDFKEDIIQKKNSSNNNGIFAKDKSWWPEICLSLIISTVILFLSAPRLFLLYDFFFGFFYCFAFFVVQTLFIIIGIIIIEYIYISITIKRKNN